jgi:hypothetical protein
VADAASRDRQQAKPTPAPTEKRGTQPRISNVVRGNIEKPNNRDSNWEKGRLEPIATISMDQARLFLLIFHVRGEPTAQPPSQLFYLDPHLAV